MFWRIIVTLICWTILGLVIDLVWNHNQYAFGWELCDPYQVYTVYYKNVNWFGAFMISLLHTLLCPIGAICYWFYKLCTIGRK